MAPTMIHCLRLLSFAGCLKSGPRPYTRPEVVGAARMSDGPGPDRTLLLVPPPPEGHGPATVSALGAEAKESGSRATRAAFAPAPRAALSPSRRIVLACSCWDPVSASWAAAANSPAVR